MNANVKVAFDVTKKVAKIVFDGVMVISSAAATVNSAIEFKNGVKDCYSTRKAKKGHKNLDVATEENTEAEIPCDGENTDKIEVEK